MLRWRLPLGAAFIAALLGLMILDHRAAVPGAFLFPLMALLLLGAVGELLGLFRAAGVCPTGWPVALGSLAALAAAWLPLALPAGNDGRNLLDAAWPLAALGLALMAAFVAEMRQFTHPGGSIVRLGGAALAILYLGGLFACLMQIRMLWGVGAVASLLIPVKMADTGAFFTGRALGRHPLTPVLSPKKTIEGGIGGLLWAAVGSWAVFHWIVPLTLPDTTPAPWWLAVLFGLAIGVAGTVGDLAESLLKRDSGCKDSSRWLPGFGGLLDMLDSAIFAAPVAWLFWALWQGFPAGR